MSQAVQCLPSWFVMNPDHSLWDDLAGHPPNLFTSPPWTTVVADTYGMTISASVRAIRGQISDAILFCHVADLRGERIVCFPFSDYCDPCVRDAATWHQLVSRLVAKQVPVTFRVLRSQLPAQDARFLSTGSAAWHGVDLGRAEDRLWAELSQDTRRNIRKAQHHGISVRAGRSLADVHTFYDMHCHIRKAKYRLLPQPFVFFERLHAAFAPDDRLTVLVAERDGEAVAATFYIEWGDTLYYKFNASIDRDGCPNDLLVWEGICLGRRHGLRLLDFGLSDLEQPGLLRFKRKYATEERLIQRFQWQPPGYQDRCAERAGRLLGQLTQLLTDPSVPDTITRSGGEALYGQFC
jgi:CelD/BcsL family acetyltransferase involved in cellulose biosynthesis